MAHTHANAGAGFDAQRFESWPPTAASTATAVVTDAAGTRYSTCEVHHQLIIERPTGERLLVGGRGTAIGELLCPRGVAVASRPSRSETRVYVCDAWNHRIQIFSGDGTPCGAFGSRGTGPGRFDVPTAIAVVTPAFPGEHLDPNTIEAGMLVVADRWNNRVQVFDLDGGFIAAIGAAADAGESDPQALSRAGWPYFRVGALPTLTQPVQLSWSAPRLTITGATGRVHRLELALALLPDFETWRAATPPALRAAAARRLLPRVPSDQVLPEPMFSAIVGDLDTAPSLHGEANAWQKAS